jgi:hypothetical protein
LQRFKRKKNEIMAKKLTKRKAFNFLRSYYDLLNELQSEDDQLNFIKAVLNKQFLDQDPEGLNFIVNICYESQRHSIEQSVSGYKQKMKTDLLGNPIEGGRQGGSVGGRQGGRQAPSVQEEEKEKEKEKLINIVSSPPDGVDPLHFYIAKTYHAMFYKYKGSKSLQNAELKTWVKTIRLLLEVDKVTVAQLVAVKHFLQAGIDKERGVDTFWSDTIYSISSLRKKSKDGIYQFDRIKQAAKKWIEKNPEKEQLVYKAETSLMKRVNGE